MPERVGRDGLPDPGLARHAADDPPGAVPVQPPPVPGQEHRSFGSLSDRQVDGPGSPRCQRDGHHLAALASDRESPVAALEAQVLDVGARGLGDPQPVQGEQRDQRVHGRQPEPGRHQQRAELIAIQGHGM